MKVQSTVAVTAHDVQVALSAYILAELGAVAKVTVTQVEEHDTTLPHYTIEVSDLVLNPVKASKTARTAGTGVKRTRRTKAEIEAANAAENTAEAAPEVVEENDPFVALLAPEVEPTAPAEFSFA